MPRPAKPKSAKAAKLTKQESYYQDLRRTISGRERKQVFDEFVAALKALIQIFGKNEAMSLFVRSGMLITLTKDSSLSGSVRNEAGNAVKEK